MKRSDEDGMIQASLRSALGDAGAIAQLRKSRKANRDNIFRTLWKDCAALGVAGALVPVNLGGTGLSFVTSGVILEEIGRSLAKLPFLSTSVLAVTAIVDAGSQDQQGELLPQICAGDLVIGIGGLEAAVGPNAALFYVRDGDSMILSGSCPWVIDGPSADLIIVAATCSEPAGDEPRMSLFLIDPEHPGIRRTPQTTLDGHAIDQLDFEAVAFERGSLLGAEGGALVLCRRLFDLGAASLSAELFGLADRAFELTVEHLKVREQFGRLIGSFQALQHRAAGLFCELELAKAAALGGMLAFDQPGVDTARISSVAKVKCSAVAKLATSEAIQMHAGIGMTDEFDIGLYFKRARVAAELFGTERLHLERFASLSGY